MYTVRLKVHKEVIVLPIGAGRDTFSGSARADRGKVCGSSVLASISHVETGDGVVVVLEEDAVTGAGSRDIDGYRVERGIGIEI
jgi:hypothetical protein